MNWELWTAVGVVGWAFGVYVTHTLVIAFHDKKRENWSEDQRDGWGLACLILWPAMMTLGVIAAICAIPFMASVRSGNRLRELKGRWE